jgi:hypothetical protein
MKRRNKIFLFGIIALQIFLLLDLKFTAWPEMTLWPYLITRGWLPYHDITIAHTPLLLLKLAVFYKIFGVGIMQLKIFTWILILALDFLVFWIAKKLSSSKTALITLSSFVIWQIFFDGNGLWFDLFMGMIILISYYFVKRKNYLMAGIFWVLAFISKQTAIWFLLPIGLEMVQGTERKIQPFKRFIIGVLVVSFLFVLILWLLGVLPDFYNWAINFGIFILPKAQGQVQLPDIKNLIVCVFPFLIFIPLLWKTGKRNINLLVWAITGSFGAYPRFEYFHFQPAIPFLAMATGLFLSDGVLKGKFVRVFIILYILGSLYLFGGYFMRNFNEGTRFYEIDVQDIASYIKSNTNHDDKIFIINWWDNIYALSDRLPAIDPWVPQLSWYTETPGIQEKMVGDLSISKPDLIILNPYSESGLSAYIPEKVYNYVLQNYELKNTIDNIEILKIK